MGMDGLRLIRRKIVGFVSMLCIQGCRLRACDLLHLFINQYRRNTEMVTKILLYAIRFSSIKSFSGTAPNIPSTSSSPP